MLWEKCHLYLMGHIFNLKNAIVCFVRYGADVNEGTGRSVRVQKNQPSHY
jgi:hypothetical protein